MEDLLRDSSLLLPVVCICGVSLVVTVFFLAIWWNILGKAGYSGALSLLFLVPVIGQLAFFIVLLMLAFSEWPVQRELHDLRRWRDDVLRYQAYYQQQPGPYSGYPAQQPGPPPQPYGDNPGDYPPGS